MNINDEKIEEMILILIKLTNKDKLHWEAVPIEENKAESIKSIQCYKVDYKENRYIISKKKIFDFSWNIENIIEKTIINNSNNKIWYTFIDLIVQDQYTNLLYSINNSNCLEDLFDMVEKKVLNIDEIINKLMDEM
jgi:hypothetical protein